MIVKKLSDVSGGGFPGARYNEMKVAAGVALLMAMENVSETLRHNVETLHRFGLDASAEVERYLKDRSQTYGNTKTTRFQFHVSASVKERIRQHTQAQARVRILPPRPQDYMPEISRVFATTLANALSSLNVSSGVTGRNREHEVSKHSRYDDIDDRQSGTKMSM